MFRLVSPGIALPRLRQALPASPREQSPEAARTRIHADVPGHRCWSATTVRIPAFPECGLSVGVVLLTMVSIFILGG